MAKFCIHCGAPLQEKMAFCTQCGKPVIDDIENVAESAAPDFSGLEFDDQTQVMVPVASTPAQSVGVSAQATQAQATYAQPVSQPALQPAPKKGMGTGAKVGIIAAACALGVGAGVALAILQPWAPSAATSSAVEDSSSASSVALSTENVTTSSSADAAEKSAATSASPNVQSSAATEASSSTSLQESSAATSSSSDNGTTEINVNVNINGEATNAESGQNTSNHIIADSATRYLSRSELEGMGSDDLSRAQNEIWARHGRKFKNQWLQDYFDTKGWYSGTISADDFTSQYKSTDIEDANASLISGILSERGWDVNRAHPN